MQNTNLASLAADWRDQSARKQPSPAQLRWLRRGLLQPTGKLPLFDASGRRVNGRMVRTCLENGWAEPWFTNPLKPAWLVCKLTPQGRMLAMDSHADAEA